MNFLPNLCEVSSPVNFLTSSCFLLLMWLPDVNSSHLSVVSVVQISSSLSGNRVCLLIGASSVFDASSSLSGNLV